MDCNYSDKIKKILEEGKKCNCNPVIVGPTGPAGPATITVGTTTTGDPGTEASVTNVGTTENVVLNFNIPQGPTGPEGPIGPTGPEGSSSLSAYGRIYDTTETPLTLVASTPQNISLGSAGPLKNITAGGDNSLAIGDTGTYLVDYYFLGSSSVNTEITVELTQNTTPIGSSTITKNVTANAETDFAGSTIIELTAGDKIALTIEATAGATVTPSSGTSSFLNILRLS